MKKSTLAFGILTLPLLSSACVKKPSSSSNPKMLNGEAVAESSELAKGVVAITTATGEPFCTGAVIGDRWVLSAVHCFMHGMGDGRYVVQGIDPAKRFRQSGTTAGIEFVAFSDRNLVFAGKDSEAAEHAELVARRHPADRDEALWDKIVNIAAKPHSPMQDIALIRLDGPLANVKPVALPTMRHAIGSALLGAGYGNQVTESQAIAMMDAGKSVPGGILQTYKADLTELWPQSHEFLVMGKNGSSACPGDSGGPLLDGNILVGVVSRGPAECREGRVVYTDVRKYVDWIACEMASQSNCESKIP